MGKYEMKKVFVCALVVPVLILFTAGFGNAATKYLVFGGGGTGGTFFLVASGMASLAERNIKGISATSEISGGSIENSRRLARGEQTFAMLSAETAYHAHRKLREFKGSKDKLQDMRLVMYGYMSVLHILAHGDSNIRSISDFKGKKISLAIGPVAKAWWPIIRDAYNLTDKDYSSVVHRPAEQMNALRDKNVDAAVYWGGAPTVSVTDLTTTQNIRFIDIGDKEGKIITKGRPYFFQGKLPANTYPRQKKDVSTLKTAITLGTTASVSPDLVYNVLKVILTHNDDLKRIHPKAAEFNKKNAVGQAVYPYHKGALKYYKEHNMMK